MSVSSTAASTNAYTASGSSLGSQYIRERAAALLPSLVAVWIFSGGLVFVEPSPYEVMFLLVLPMAIVAGFGLYRSTINLLNMLLLFAPFAIIGAFQPKYFELSKTLIYVIVTIFLWFTAYFVANYVADSPTKRMRGIVKAYTVIAILASLIGITAYLGILPGRDLFLRYGRARATFNDPNVYGPFLMLPAMFALQRVFLLKGTRQFIPAIIYVILFVGVFVSFSRAAWGHLALSSVILYVSVFLLEARAQDKVRMLLLAIIGTVGLMFVLAFLLSIEAVRDLFLQRFSINQNYDTGSTGRFGRIFYALELALSHPWGLGPFEFTQLRIVEAPHNTYIKVILSYGWMGGLLYISLIGATLYRCLKYIFISSPNRFLLLPLFATYVPLILESAIIDTDHWRHFFLITGLIWGVTTCYTRPNDAPRTKKEAIV